jgi:hypothetical protein
VYFGPHPGRIPSPGSFLIIDAVESQNISKAMRLPFILRGADVPLTRARGDAMRYRWILLGVFLWGGIFAPPILASTGDIGTIVEKFVVRQFPGAASHYWIINETQWDGDEMIVDLQTIVTERRDTEPTQSRFLLLIVAGELRGSQHLPLEPEADCRPEEA